MLEEEGPESAAGLVRMAVGVADDGVELSVEAADLVDGVLDAAGEVGEPPRSGEGRDERLVEGRGVDGDDEVAASLEAVLGPAAGSRADVDHRVPLRPEGASHVRPAPAALLRLVVRPRHDGDFFFIVYASRRLFSLPIIVVFFRQVFFSVVFFEGVGGVAEADEALGLDEFDGDDDGMAALGEVDSLGEVVQEVSFRSCGVVAADRELGDFRRGEDVVDRGDCLQ
mmetsp:Transcript_30820/g.99375  ORF Transcript_30820/g.99375 Transcript_30820/m.99375 type:complete len:226 (+) Transcript_30820:2238-2915(+)